MAETGFCGEHSEVMRCLGALEEGQRNQGELLRDMSGKIDLLVRRYSNGEVKRAVSDAKSGILYWALAVTGVAGISALTNYLVKRFGG